MSASPTVMVLLIVIHLKPNVKRIRIVAVAVRIRIDRGM
jgi:hypothetical protein